MCSKVNYKVLGFIILEMHSLNMWHFIELIYTLNFNIPLTHPCPRLHVNLSNEFIKHSWTTH